MCEVCGAVLDLLVRSAVTPLPKQDKCMLCFHWGWQSLGGCSVCVGLIADSYTRSLRSQRHLLRPAMLTRTARMSLSAVPDVYLEQHTGTGCHEGHVCELWLSKAASLQASNLNHVS